MAQSDDTSKDRPVNLPRGAGGLADVLHLPDTPENRQRLKDAIQREIGATPAVPSGQSIAEATIADLDADPAKPAAEPRRCYYICPTQRFNPDVATKGYVPSIVTEGEPGHTPLMGRGECAEPWYWGKSLKEAQDTADRANLETFGLTPEEAWKIVDSSMAAGSTNR